MEITRSNILAKILASENVDLIVNEMINTASFDLIHRVVRIPEKMFSDDNFSLMVIGHEISHCLHTPSEYRTFQQRQEHRVEEAKRRYMSSTLNIVEDVRVDKLIQRKYPGIKKYYKLSVEYIDTQDFFKIRKKNLDIGSLSFIDKLCIWSKMDDRESFITYNVPFDAEEWEYVKKCKAAEKFSEIEELTIEILNKFDIKKDIDNLDSDHQEADDENEEKNESASGDGKGDQEKKSKISGGLSDGKLLYEFWEEGVDSGEGLSSQLTGGVKKIIDTKPNFKDLENNNPSSSKITTILNSYRIFNNTFVRNFMMKKRARELSKMQFSNTGILDSNNLYKYKFQEDIFLKNEIEQRQKNHGFIFMIDCSSSMSNIFSTLTEQLLSFYDILKKLDIPFEFYGFTTKDFQRSTGSYNFTNNCLMYNFLSNKTKKVDAYSIFDKILRGDIYLGGTPTSEALVNSFPLIENFKAKYPVDILNYIIITDGADGIYANETYVSYKGSLHKNVYSPRGLINYNAAIYKIMREFFDIKILHMDITDTVPNTLLNNSENDFFKNHGYLRKEEFGGSDNVFYVKENLIRNRSTEIVQTLTDILA